MRGQKPMHGAKRVVEEVKRRTGIAFTVADHAAAARYFAIRPPRGNDDATMDDLFAEYFPAFKNYLYTQRWIDRLVDAFGDERTYEATCGRPPRREPAQLPIGPAARGD
jgi:hypothetical protein